MRFFPVSLLIFLTIGFSVYAQPPQPKTPPAKKQFVSDEGGFTINFPVRATRSSRQMEAAFGNASQVTYQASTKTAFYMAGFIDFPAPIADEEDLDIRYDMVADSVLSRKGSKLVEQRRIYVGENLGREYVVEALGATVTMRCFMVKQRMFQLAFSTNGSISKGSAAFKKSHATRAADFFDSFAVTSIPDARLEVVELPNDFGISLQERVFIIDYFGLEITFPEDWEIADDEFNETLLEIVREEAATEKPKTARELEYSLANSRILATGYLRSEDSAAVLLVAAEKVSIPNFVPKMFIDGYVSSNLDPGEVLIKRVDKEMIGGVEFAWAETGIRKESQRTRMYVANRRGIALEITISYETQKQLEASLAVLRTLKFRDFAPAK